jgi:hypothetical protein
LLSKSLFIANHLLGATRGDRSGIDADIAANRNHQRGFDAPRANPLLAAPDYTELINYKAIAKRLGFPNWPRRGAWRLIDG